MQELVELNKYIHDFSSAMWTCGAVVVWLLARAARRDESARAGIVGVALQLYWITLPSLVISLVSGGFRAAAYTSYEYTGPITSTLLAVLVVKHIAFTALVVWGIWVHVATKRLTGGTLTKTHSDERTED